MFQYVTLERNQPKQNFSLRILECVSERGVATLKYKNAPYFTPCFSCLFPPLPVDQFN